MNKLITLLAILSAVNLSAVDFYEPSKTCCSSVPASYAYLGYTWGHGIETKHNYSTSGVLFYPNFSINKFHPFITLTGNQFNEKNRWSGNVGIGARWQKDCHLVGLNVFYDYFNFHKNFNQVGVGAEYLSYTWEGRINGYIPVGNQTGRHTTAYYDDYVGPYFVKISDLIRTHAGFDAEAGYNFYTFCNLRFYGGVGPAWYHNHNNDNSHRSKDKWYFKGRLLAQWNNFLQIEGRGFKTYDEQWGWQGMAILTIPFELFEKCGCVCQPLEDLYSRLIYRNTAIKTSSSCYWETNY